MADEQRLRSWRETISAVMEELIDLTWQRKQMSRFIDIVESNPALISGPNPFPFDVNTWFRVYAAMAIRRLATGGDAHSLYALLQGMIANPQAYQRKDLRATIKQQHRPDADPMLIDYQTDDIWESIAAEDGISLSREKIGRDVGKLNTVSERIRAYANARLAHALKEPLRPHQIPKDDDVDNCIDDFAAIASRYSNILYGGGMSEDLDSIEQFDWYDIWRFPWMIERDAHEPFFEPAKPVVVSTNSGPIAGLNTIAVHRPATPDCPDCIQLTEYWTRDIHNPDGTFARHVTENAWDGDGHGVPVWTVDDKCWACSGHATAPSSEIEP